MDVAFLFPALLCCMLCVDTSRALCPTRAVLNFIRQKEFLPLSKLERETYYNMESVRYNLDLYDGFRTGDMFAPNLLIWFQEAPR
jgi:hypothetical protein